MPFKFHSGRSSMITMAKLSNADAVRKARAAGLSTVEAVAIARLHTDEQDLTDLIKASVEESGKDDTAPTGANMGQGNRARGEHIDKASVSKMADTILGG